MKLDPPADPDRRLRIIRRRRPSAERELLARADVEVV
jgi:hypothetical protein